MRRELRGERGGPGDVRGIEACAVELQKAEGGEGVVVQLRGQGRDRVLIAHGAQRLRRAGPGLFQQKGGQRLGVLQVAPILKDPGGLGERQQHQAVPAGEELAVRAEGAAL